MYLLVDLGLPDMSGLDVIRFVAQRHPNCDILVISMFGDEANVLAALEAGASGYLLKGLLARDVAADIRDLRAGGSPLSPVIARQVLKRLKAAPGPAAPAQAAAIRGGCCACTSFGVLLSEILTKMIAYCGLVCSDCPAFLATRSDDDIARGKVAALWTEKFGHDFKPEDINCEGCKSEGKRLVGYRHVCPIRKCALARGVESCARV